MNFTFAIIRNNSLKEVKISSENLSSAWKDIYAKTEEWFDDSSEYDVQSISLTTIDKEPVGTFDILKHSFWQSNEDKFLVTMSKDPLLGMSDITSTFELAQLTATTLLDKDSVSIYKIHHDRMELVKRLNKDFLNTF